MPDDAQQRLRRAQHPGHRRQAHPAHPQRDEHRLRGRRLRPGDRPPGAAVRRRRPGWTTSPAGAASSEAVPSPRCRCSGSRASATSWRAIKIAKYLDLGPDDVIVTVATDGASDVRQRAGPDRGPRLPRRLRRGRRGRGLRPVHARRGHRRPAGDHARRTGGGSSTSATSPGSSSRACSLEDVRRALGASRSGPACAAKSAALGRDDRRVQRPDRGHAVSRARPARSSARAAATVPSASEPLPVPLPQRRGRRRRPRAASGASTRPGTLPGGRRARPSPFAALPRPAAQLPPGASPAG